MQAWDSKLIVWGCMIIIHNVHSRMIFSIAFVLCFLVNLPPALMSLTQNITIVLVHRPCCNLTLPWAILTNPAFTAHHQQYPLFHLSTVVACSQLWESFPHLQMHFLQAWTGCSFAVNLQYITYGTASPTTKVSVLWCYDTTIDSWSNVTTSIIIFEHQNSKCNIFRHTRKRHLA